MHIIQCNLLTYKKNGSSTVNIYSQICSSLSKILGKLSNNAKSAKNITYKQFFDTYISNENISLLLGQCFNNINDNDVSNKTQYEQLASEIIHKQQDTNLLTALLYKFYKGNFILFSIHLSNTENLLGINNNSVVLFERLANDLANAKNNDSAGIILSVYINLINNIIKNKLL